MRGSCWAEENSAVWESCEGKWLPQTSPRSSEKYDASALLWIPVPFVRLISADERDGAWSLVSPIPGLAF